MATKYTLQDLEGNVLKTTSKKQAAIKAATDQGLLRFRVVTDAGNTVYEQVPEAPETSQETAEEDLIGEVAPEPEKKFDIAAMKSKISKLLAKAEGTDNEHERDAFNAQAERLMLKLGIQAAELEAAGEAKAEEVVQEVREWHGNYSIVMVPFTGTLADGFGNLTVLQSTVSPMLRRTYIIGHKSDVKAFLLLLDSLHIQVMSALHRWQKDNRERRRFLTDMQKYVEHRSFIAGFGRTCALTLAKMRRDEEKEASTGAALVLASKQERVQEWVDNKYGEMKSARGGMQYWSSGAHADGAVAGNSADLGEKRIEG